MKSAVILLITVAAVATEEYYDSKYEAIKLDEILSPKQDELKAQIACYLDKGPCSPLVQELKELAPEIYATACAKCSPAQKKLVYEGLQFMTIVTPEELDQLIAKYDPGFKYTPALLSAVKNA